MEPGKKKRSENWSSEEKEILRHLISQSANILENKCNKTAINTEESKEWKNIMLKLNEITGKSRSDGEIKLAWKRMKLAAKANLSAHRQQQFQTGGGEKPPSPSQEDLSIMAIAPHDFIIEVNDFDSDSVQTMSNENLSHENALPDPSTATADIQYITTEVPEFSKATVEDLTINKPKQRKKASQNTSQTMRESIVESNTFFKKRQLEILDVEHSYNIKIAELKIKKLELEISILQNKKNI